MTALIMLMTYYKFVLRILVLLIMAQLTQVGCSIIEKSSKTSSNLNTINSKQKQVQKESKFDIKLNNKISSLRNKCNKAEKELDKCSARLLAFGLKEVTFPNNIEQLDSEYCPNFRKVVGCIRNNTDCYKPFERQIINWVLTSSRKMNYKRCKVEVEKSKFLRLTNSCFLQEKFEQMKSPMDKCMRNYVANLEAIADLNDFIQRLSENDYQIQLSCCANKRFKQCILSNAKRHCKPPFENLKKLKRTNSITAQRNVHKQLAKLMEDTMADLTGTLDNMALTGPEFICKSVDENFCNTHFDNKIIGRFTKHKSIVPAMVKIYSNL